MAGSTPKVTASVSFKADRDRPAGGHTGAAAIANPAATRRGGPYSIAAATMSESSTFTGSMVSAA